MSKLLRSDFYRLFRSISFYICTIVAMGLMAINIILMDMANKMTEGETVFDITSRYKDGISYGLTAFSNGNVQMLLSIVLAIFVTAEFSHGTMKNVVSKGFSKLQIYFSKLITMLAATYIIIIATFIVGTLAATVIIGNIGDLNSDYLVQIFKTGGIEILLNTALVALLLLVAMVIRNLGGTIAINAIGIMSFGPLIFSLLEYLVKGKIKFSEFSLLNNIAFLANVKAESSDYIRAIIVGVVFFTVSTTLGIIAFRKADVK